MLNIPDEIQEKYQEIFPSGLGDWDLTDAKILFTELVHAPY